MTCRWVIGLLGVLMHSIAWGAAPPIAPGDAASLGRELDTIRDQLVALDIEKALAAVDSILDRPGLPETTRVVALDLRAQAHVASDDLDAAEKDYRAILELEAGYVPAGDVTSKKAMDRFVRIQASMIGTVHLDLDPKDASITVGGRSVPISGAGAFPAVAGERKLHLARKGYDAQDVDVRVVPAQETLLRIRLVPNARSLVVRTDVDGVSVTLDGVVAGVTAREGDAGSDPSAPAALVIDDVAIGDHDLRLEKACFETEALEEIVSVDLADRSPKLLRVVSMRPARTRVTATGALYEGELRVDGKRVASLPLTSFAMCPGTRALEVVASGRVIWSGVIVAEESDLTLDLRPRPSAVLVGAAWPSAWAAVVSEWSVRDRVDAPSGADLTSREGWSAVPLPPGTDLAVGVIPRAGVAGDDRIVLYGPALHELEDRASPPDPSRPSWNIATIGAVLVDGETGSVVLASVSLGGPAARAGLVPGDRLVAIGGRAVANAASARAAIVASGILAKLVLDVASPAGAPRKVECVSSGVPWITPPSRQDASRIVLAAWASVDAAAGGPDAAQALANLARLLERAGRDGAALDAWRRVRSIGEGALWARAVYAHGAGLQAAGKRDEAIEAFGQARSAGQADGDTTLVAATTDRLADLGVAPR